MRTKSKRTPEASASLNRANHADGELNAGGDRVVFEIEKNSIERIRATIARYKGNRYAHLRVYYLADDGEWRPTAKGIALSVDRLDELEAAVAALRAAVGNSPERDVA
jgi:hypothetical protein